MSERYEVKGNNCSCHPETCVCDDLVIYDNKLGATYMTLNDYQTALEICKIKNQENTND
ncbi:MAG: hypothetical protein GOVbin4162_88 [Prokaryotic dsDNA virus sp.]|nr:MAG: hypothetical protein GOVbin4162_88 [Prokaryotic dsDNA virus sp.]